MLLAAVAMLDSRAGALVDRTGTEPGGIGAGFYPFWSATLVFVCSAVIAYGALGDRRVTPAAFAGRDSVVAVLKLIIPMVAATTALVWLGFYIVSALYMGLFARWLGRYRWPWVAVLTIAMPAAIYATFELGFKVTLPKSFLYNAGILPF
jgi:hypothetical protein